MTRQLWRGAILSLLVLAAVLTSAPTSTAHPLHPQVTNEILGGQERLESGRWIAQSFLTRTGFFVSRVSIFAADVGTSDPVTVSLRTNAEGTPSTTDLTAGSGDGVATAGWVDIDLDPFVELFANQTYWIVARSDAPLGLGYHMWDSGDDLAYASGIGARSLDGLTWSPGGRDFAFRVYGFPQPRLTFGVMSSRSNISAGETVAFQVTFSNTGPGTAASLSINATLHSDLVHASDDAESIGGVRVGSGAFAFTNVLPGTYAFSVIAMARQGTPNGTLALTSFSFDATDHNGAPLPRSTRTATVTIENPTGDAGPASSTWLWWLLVAVGGIAGLIVFLMKRREPRLTIEDVFVSDQSGILLAHRSSTLIPYQDEDLLLAMFKVVQDFIRDAFSKGTDEQMRSIEFGDRKILIERGRRHAITVVYRGTDYGELANRVRKVSQEIEEEFGHTIEAWDGTMDAVRGITLLLPKVWKGHRALPASG